MVIIGLVAICSVVSFAGIPEKPSVDDVKRLVADQQFHDYAGLTSAISKNTDWSFRVFAYQYIGEKGKIEAFDPFIKVYAREPHPVVQGVLLAQLGHFATMTTRKADWNGVGTPFLSVLSAEDREKVFALAKQESNPSKHEAIRQTAIGVLGQFARPETADLLAKATTDPSRGVSAVASSVIRFQGGPQAKEFWLRQLKEGTPALQRDAVDALAVLDDPSIDAVLKDLERGDDPNLVDTARKWLEWRANKRDSQARLEKALHPNALDKFFSILIKGALSAGWYAVAILVIPCILASTWSFRNDDFQTLATGAFFLSSLIFGAVSARLKIDIGLPIEFVAVLGGGALLAALNLKRIVALSVETIVFDLLIIAGYFLIGASFIAKSMSTFLWAGVPFALSILLGFAQALYFLRKHRYAEASHCIAYSSVAALVLGCLPLAFVGM